jgi:non-ribosomal peptide synthase protein (TIGR01720 family)
LTARPGTVDAHWGQGQLEAVITRAWAELLGYSPPSDRNVFDLGADSMAVVRLCAALGRLGIQVGIAAVFAHPTVSQLASLIVKSQASIGPAMAGPLPLVPAQARFFESNPEPPADWTTAARFRVARPLQEEQLRTALRGLIARHDALRLRLRFERGRWQQRTDPEPGPVALEWRRSRKPLEPMDLTRLAIENRSVLNGQHGPFIAVTYVDRAGYGTDLLTIAVHHLAFDLFSWAPLLEDLEALCAQSPDEMLAGRSASFREWSLRLTEYAQSNELVRQARDWSWLPHETAGGWPRVHARGPGNGTYASGQTVTEAVDFGTTRRLMRMARGHAGMLTLLLTALHRCDAQADVPLAVNLTHHGRVGLLDLNISRTVGAFMSVYPFAIPVTHAGPEAEVHALAARLRTVPPGGVAYGALRYLGSAGALPSVSEPAVALNYRGVYEAPSTSLFEFVDASCGPGYGPHLQREHLLYLSAWIRDGCLEVHWGYSDERLEQARVRILAGRFRQVLEDLARDHPGMVDS